MIRYYNEEDRKDVLNIFNQSQHSPMSLERFRTLDQEAQRSDYWKRLVLEVENSIVAYANLIKRPGLRNGYLFATIQVDVNHRRKGYGTALWHRLWKIIQDQKPKGLETVILDTDIASKKWAESKGFRLRFHQFDSILDLTNHCPRFQLSEVPITCHGVKYVSLSNESHKDQWNRLYHLFLQLCKDTPDFYGVEELNIDFAKHFLSSSGIRADGIWIAKDADKWIGMTVLRDISKKEMWNAFTGVCSDYRGRGIASILKSIAADYAYSQNVNILRTFNLSVNKGILKINQRMGYIPQPGRWIMERSFIVP
ncbi:GNAT family N-acetyltransferase [Thermoflavimicrobium dichotomicum]|uniref:L-amino acid N-acyltransferase YncA n=1 Tax=Thermoflavimicrobium dichotomicum TaxID=46223 RepID=A0A1I3U0Q9_9BACL|nr:GNAT family N-acetyltransferase [Thermoflavimicrobium dichotomicum]SFJ75371.1 L-amino acid N-acyltransferase YncA [Thermoflavimicrobium dichotomicum]